MVWLPRLLFTLSVALAIGLIVLVLTAPWMEESDAWLELFAQDTVVRRTALVSAAGLVVTAMVFFRPGLFRSQKPRSKLPPPGNFAGA